MGQLINKEQAESFLLTNDKYSLINLFTRLPQAIKTLLNNTEEIKHAIKVTLSAIIVMLIWSVTQWPAAIIACVSVLAVAQLNMYSSKKKAQSRILGCVLGGMLGIILIGLALPATYFYLSVILAACLFAYFSTGRDMWVDIGIQANIALFTATVVAWKAPIAVMPAVERIAGVLLGSIIAATIGYFLWPANVITNIHKNLAKNYQEFAQWLKILIMQPEKEAEQLEIVKLKRLLISRMANCESLFVYLPTESDEKKYQRILELQYHLMFNLLSLNSYRNILVSVATVLEINIFAYLQKMTNKIFELADLLLHKKIDDNKTDINTLILLTRKDLAAIRKHAKIIDYEVYQAKEFIVVLNNLIQLLACLQCTENELANKSCSSQERLMNALLND